MPVMAVRPNPMNYGSSRCKRFLSCLQRPVVCGEREREGNRKKERERERFGFMQCHPEIHLPFSIPHLYYLSVFYQEKNSHYFQLPSDKNIILLITRLKFLMNMWLTSARKSDYLARSYFLKRRLEIGYFWRNIFYFFFQLDGGVCVKWNHDTFYISPPFLFITCWWFWK